MNIININKYVADFEVQEIAFDIAFGTLVMAKFDNNTIAKAMPAPKLRAQA